MTEAELFRSLGLRGSMPCQDCADAQAYAPADATNVQCYACEREDR